MTEPSLPSPRDADADRRARRVRQVALAALLAMAASLIGSLATGRAPDLPPFAVAAVMLSLTWMLAGTRRTELAAWLLMFSLAGVVGALVWRNSGLRDPAIMAYPTVLLFAALLGQGRLLATIWLVSLFSLAAVWLATLQGWRVQSPVPPAGLGTLVDAACILSVSAFGIWLMASDLLQALAHLKRENARVRESESRAEHIAGHDALTALPNRTLARDRFSRFASLAARRPGLLGLLYLDLDRFKSVNDALGQRAGDELLQQVGQRLATLVRESDTVARTGGDEFLLLLPELSDEEDAALVAQKVLDRLREPFVVGGVDVTVGASVGIALFPRDGGDFDTLIRRADTAMYRAKDAGRGAWRFFDAAMDAHIIEHVRLAAAMHTALARGEFELHYQPQVALGSGRIVGAEALIRWRHPELGLVPPARFIPVAEHCGLIVPIGDWVLREACRQAATWSRERLGDFWIAVNVSPVQFRRGDVDRVVAAALDESGLAPGRLELELTESLLLDDSPSLDATMERLRRIGVTLSIDDFGTGYSNMAYLKRLRVQRLKIDRSFVADITSDPQDEAIVRAIVQVAQSLGLSTIAEGIEDAATLERLAAMGCPLGQGYHWARPLPAAEFAAYVRARQGAAGGHETAPPRGAEAVAG